MIIVNNSEFFGIQGHKIAPFASKSMLGSEFSRPGWAGRQIWTHEKPLSSSTFLCFTKWQHKSVKKILKIGLSRNTEEETWVCHNMIYMLIIRNHSFRKTHIYVKYLWAPWIKHPFSPSRNLLMSKKGNINKNPLEHDRYLIREVRTYDYPLVLIWFIILFLKSIHCAYSKARAENSNACLQQRMTADYLANNDWNETPLQ